MPIPKVVIFDLDNTLVINKPAAKAAYESAIRFIAKETKMEFNKLYSHWKRLVQQLSTESAPEKRAFEYSLSTLTSYHHISDKLIPPALKIYEKELLTALRPMAGAKELVSWIKEQGGLVAIAAGTDRNLAKKKLKITELLPYIDLIISTTEVGTMKPNVRFYELILAELHATKSNAIVISDSKKEDLTPATQFGLKTLELQPNHSHLTQFKPQLAEFLSYSK